MTHKLTGAEEEFARSIRMLRNGMRHVQRELMLGKTEPRTIALVIEGYMAAARKVEKAAIAMSEADDALASVVAEHYKHSDMTD